MITEAFLKDIPKTDLHLHLDGSLRLESLIEMARERGVELPSMEAEGLKELVFKEGYADLVEYLRGFQYTCGVMTDPEALERVAYELAWDNLNEGVRYFEVRFAPMLHVNDRLSLEDVLVAVNKGLAKAKSEFNTQLEKSGDDSPPFEYGMIVCAMRMFSAVFSPYYKKICEAHTYMPLQKLYGLASLELARAVVDIRDRTALPIVGFDLAGAEAGNPAENHREAYDFVHRNFMRKTVHAGEAYGAESIFQAITDLHADRIGHGYHLFDADFIQDPRITNKAGYIENLAGYIADTRLTIEVCLSSNMDTDPTLTSIGDHPFKKMKEHQLSTTICTDNRLVSRTTVSRELGLAVKHFNLTPRQLKNIVIYGFKRSFFPLTYTQRRAYVRRIIDFYSTVEKKHQVDVEKVAQY
jgi:adenosine deaminase